MRLTYFQFSNLVSCPQSATFQLRGLRLAALAQRLHPRCPLVRMPPQQLVPLRVLLPLGQRSRWPMACAPVSPRPTAVSMRTRRAMYGLQHLTLNNCPKWPAVAVLRLSQTHANSLVTAPPGIPSPPPRRPPPSLPPPTPPHARPLAWKVVSAPPLASALSPPHRQATARALPPETQPHRRAAVATRAPVPVGRTPWRRTHQAQWRGRRREARSRRGRLRCSPTRAPSKW